MTTLTVNGADVAATTLTAAGKLFAATGGTSGSASTKVGTAGGTSTSYLQLQALGTTASPATVTSIPAPSDATFFGWLLDATTLENQQLSTGNWTPTFHVLSSTAGGVITCTLQIFKRSSAGAYTQIGSDIVGSAVTLTTSAQSLGFAATSLPVMSFVTGDKLAMWLWMDITTAGGTATKTVSVVEAASGATAGTASEAQTVTPGYVPVVTTTYSFTDVLDQQVYVQDTFARANTAGNTTVSNAAGWGTSSDSNTWTNLHATDTPTFSINGDRGEVTTSALDNQLALSSTIYGDVEVLVRLTTAVIASNWNGVMLRDTGGITGYLCILRNTAGAQLSIVKDVAGGTIIASATFSWSSSVPQWIRFRAVGPNLFAKAWADGTTEPSAWTITTTHTAYTSGRVGIFSSPNLTTQTVFFDSFVVKDASGTIDIPSALFRWPVDALSAADVGNLQSWPVDALTGVEVDLGVDIYHPADVLSADDSASTMVSGPAGGGTTTTTYSFTEALSASDFLLASDGSLYIEANSASDSLGGGGTGLLTDSLSTSDALLETDTALPLDALSASEILLASDGSLSTEANSASDILLETDTELSLDALVISDVGGSFRWPVDGLTASDILLGVDASLLLDGISGVEVDLATDIFAKVDALVADDSASTMVSGPAGGVTTTTYSFTEALVASDFLLVTDSDIPLDALTASDGSLTLESSLFMEANAASDSLGGGGTGLLVDSLSTSDSLLRVDVAIMTEANSASDSQLTGQSSSSVESLSTSDSLLTLDGYVPLDVLTAGDIGTIQRWPVDSLTAVESMFISDSYLPAEVQSVAESILAGDSARWVDALVVSDTSSMVLVSAAILLYLSATWVTRDSNATWMTRDGKITWTTRDENAGWNTRDEKVSWDTRDDIATWKTRQ